MAFQTTHLIFAKQFLERRPDLLSMDVHSPDDAEGLSQRLQFFAGALYPDTRYISGVDRQLTHPRDFDAWHLPDLNPFQLGWYTHLYYDRAQFKEFTLFEPELAGGGIALYSPLWAVGTALKMAMDILLLESSDHNGITEVFSLLDPSFFDQQFDESEVHIEQFLDIYRQLHIEERPSIESYLRVLENGPCPADILEMVKHRAYAIITEPEKMKQLLMCHERVLAKV